MLIEHAFEKRSQPLHLSREDLVPGIEGAAQGDSGHAKCTRGRAIQISLKLVDCIAQVGLDGLRGGRSFARDQNRDSISSKAQIGFVEAH